MDNLYTWIFWVGTATERGSFTPEITGTRFFTTDTQKLAVWNGTGWTEIGPGAAGAVAWGSITGTLSNQTDLNTALNGKAPTAHTHAQSDVTNLVTDLAGKEPANANIQAHVTSAHAPSNAQKNSDILKSEIEAVLTGVISTHSHAATAGDISLAPASDQTILANTCRYVVDWYEVGNTLYTEIANTGIMEIG
jgi:hypothetical protein